MVSIGHINIIGQGRAAEQFSNRVYIDNVTECVQPGAAGAGKVDFLVVPPTIIEGNQAQQFRFRRDLVGRDRRLKAQTDFLLRSLCLAEKFHGVAVQPFLHYRLLQG